MKGFELTAAHINNLDASRNMAMLSNLGPISNYVLRLHSLRELCLAQVIGDMHGSAK